MNCPVCHDVTLIDNEIEPGLEARDCTQCGGRWLPASRYQAWLAQHGPNLPERESDEPDEIISRESGKGKICPECGHILLPFPVGHGLAFRLDHCDGCGGVWLDHNEWETLKARNLHDDIHRIFTGSWQASVARERHRAERERILLARFGAEDFARLRDVKRWLDSHPERVALGALLASDETL